MGLQRKKKPKKNENENETTKKISYSFSPFPFHKNAVFCRVWRTSISGHAGRSLALSVGPLPLPLVGYTSPCRRF